MTNKNCKDCIYVLDLKDDLEELKIDVKEFEKKVNKIEIISAERKQQMVTIFESLKKIEHTTEFIEKSADNYQFKLTVRQTTLKLIILLILIMLLSMSQGLDLNTIKAIFRI
ncbi:hypothetical protein [Clostridium tyrobutyricum]|jgi:hypothetical protein|uniref:hypothetical protein n=1 Tax=Clostridium tyrobutyricum TaxID=1519 RepID=UPI0010A9D57A|nr:hypothetical protein [Clostridium tyrobutyricum]QCH29050.1 hypothetical protein EZN00_02675 [Clostridium tyrobutyricum]